MLIKHRLSIIQLDILVFLRLLIEISVNSVTHKIYARTHIFAEIIAIYLLILIRIIHIILLEFFHFFL